MARLVAVVPLLVLIFFLSSVAGQVVVLSGAITVTVPAPSPRSSEASWYESDLSTFYGVGRVRSSSRTLNFFYNVYLSSFDIERGGNVTVILLNSPPIGCFLDYVSVPLIMGRYGRSGPYGGDSRFWVIYGESTSSRWLYNITVVHDGSVHSCGVYFSNPAIYVGAVRSAYPWFLVGLSIFVLTVSVVGGFAVVRWKLMRFRYY